MYSQCLLSSSQTNIFVSMLHSSVGSHSICIGSCSISWTWMDEQETKKGIRAKITPKKIFRYMSFSPLNILVGGFSRFSNTLGVPQHCSKRLSALTPTVTPPRLSHVILQRSLTYSEVLPLWTPVITSEEPNYA